MNLINNRYQLLEKIGAGGMGMVFKGVDSRTQRPVAIKQLRLETVSHDTSVFDRFKREGEALRELNHPNIVKILDTVEQEGQSYLVMEYVDGGDLAKLLEKEGPLPIEHILKLSIELADALTRAHHLKIIHRDLKPGNVLLAPSGTPLLTDFGIAYFATKERLTDTGFTIGTLDYLSPEALNGQMVDNRTDVWAFGVIMFEMLVGQRPFRGETPGQVVKSILVDPFPDLEAQRPDCPVALVDLVYRMLEKDRDARIRSMRRVGVELETIILGDDQRSALQPPVQSRQRTPDLDSPTVRISSSSLDLPAANRFETPVSASASRVRHNLPSQITPFVGRESELNELGRLLRTPDVHLVTILGPGGMGKTRLSLQIASMQLERFADGVYFVDLAPLTAPESIVPAIGEAIPFSFRGADDLEQQLLNYLQTKEMLLVMDNFEHVIQGAAVVANILRAAPDVMVLATSRERLNLHGEHVFIIGGMEFPTWETPEDALEYSAVKLFVQSARRARSDFELTVHELDYVARICKLVQGMPLGIELAAAWVGTLQLHEIADEITRSLDFLASEMRDVPERHRSIRAVLEYSWNLLDEAERRVFALLSIFQGGFTREAAMEVTNASLRILMALVNKSLLARSPDGRFRMHELLRQYAQDHIPDRSTIRERHTEYYLEFLKKRYYKAWTDRQLEATGEIEAEIENIRVALDWAIEHTQAEWLGDKAFTIFTYYQYRGLYVEAAALFEKMSAMLRRQPETEKMINDLAQSLVCQGWMYIRLGRIAQAEEVLQESHALRPNYREPLSALSILASIRGDLQLAVALARDAISKDSRLQTAPDFAGLAVSYYALANAHLGAGEYEQARHNTVQALKLVSEKGEQWFRAYLLNDLGRLARVMGDYDKAQRYFEASYVLRKRFRDPEGMGLALNNLGTLALLKTNFSQALRLFNDSYAIYKDIGDRGGLANALLGLGNAHRGLDELDEAWQVLHAALELTVAIDSVPLTLTTLIGLAEVLWAQSQQARSIELLTVVEQHPLATHESRQRAEQLLAAYSRSLPPDTLDRATEPTRDLTVIVQDILEAKRPAI